MKLNILFVDDEVNLIGGLKRMLRPLRNEWDFHFANSGKEALQILSQNVIDVVVSDMRMPQMDGAQLLSEIKEKYPAIIRIILSGQSDEVMSLKSTLTAHQFIAKPVEANELKNKISRAYNLYSILNSENLRKVINGIDKLPSLPETYLKIESELKKDNFSMRNVGEIISSDIVMTAKVLQIVNSAFFGLATQVTNVSQAVNLLGADTIKSLVLLAQVFKSFEGNEKLSILLSQVYQHSLLVAKNAKQIIRKYHDDSKMEDTAHLAGLLHDIGKIVILNTKSYREKILDEINNNGVSFDEAEKLVLGTTHAEIGAYLVSLWGLPDEVVDTILMHHKPDIKMEGKMSILGAVYLANSITDGSQIKTDIIKKMGLEDDLTEIFEPCNS